MRRVLLASFGLLVAALGGLLIAPNFVNWNAHKERVSAELSKIAGRAVHIDGALSLRLLPSPTLSASRVRLDNVANGEASTMASFEAIEARIALTPLLEGRFVVESAILVEPEIILERLTDGRVNWQFWATSAAQNVPELSRASNVPFTVEFDDVRIQNGTVTYRNTAADTIEHVKKIDAVVTAASPSGPFRAKGTMNLRGMALTGELGLGRIVMDEDIPLSLAIGTTAGASRAEFMGFLTVHPNTLHVRGKLEASSDDLATTLATFSTTAVNPYLAHPLELEGALVASQNAIAINDLSFRLGDITGNGEANVVSGTVARANVVLNIGQIDLDVLRAAAAQAGPKTVASTATIHSREFILPADVAAGFEIKIGAVVHNGGIAREIKLIGELANGNLAISQASALLPGGSSLSLFGLVSALGGEPAFEGQVEAASDNFRGILQWLGLDVASVPQGRLRKLIAQAAVNASLREVTITDIDVQVDVSRVRGGIAIALRDRPGLGIGLSLDRLDLSAYLPVQSDNSNGPEDTAILREYLDALTKTLDRFDSRLDLKATSLTIGGIAIQDVHLDGTLKDGALDLRNATIADVAGASISAAGKFDVLGDTPSLDIQLSVEMEDPSPLLRLAGIVPPTQIGATTFDTLLKGNLDHMSLDAELELLEAHIEIKGNVTALDTEPQYDLALSAQHNSLSQLFIMFIDTAKEAGANIPLSLSGTMRGNRSDAVVDLTLGLDGGTLTAAGTVSSLNGVPTASLAIATAHPDVVRLMQVFYPDFSPALARLGALRLEGALTYGPNEVVLSQLAGAFGPVQVDGVATLDRTSIHPFLEVQLTTGDIVLDWFLETVMPIQADDHVVGLWSREPIDLAILSAIDMLLVLRAPSLTHGPYRVEEPKIELEIADGALNLRRLVGRAYDGDIAVTASLEARDGAAVELSFKINDADAASLSAASQEATTDDIVGSVLKLLFPVSGLQLGSGRVDAEILVTSVGRNEFDLISGLSGKAGLTFTNVVITGIDLCQVNKRLYELDDIDSLLSLFATTVEGGKTRIDDFTGGFIIEEGIANVMQPSLTSDCAIVNLSGTVDLPRWRMHMEARANLPEHTEFPGFIVEQSGPIDMPNTRLANLNDINGYILDRAARTKLRMVVPELIPRQVPQLAVPQTQPMPDPKVEVPLEFPSTRKTKPAPQEPTLPDPEKIFQGIVEGLIGR